MQQELELFTKWFERNGGFIHSSAELAFDETRGVYLRRKPRSLPIALGSIVVQCPHKLSLSALDQASKDATRFSQDFLENARPQLIGVACLLQEFKKHNSYWGPYLRILPLDRFTTPMYFQEDDKILFKGTNVERGAIELERLWNGEMKKWNSEMTCARTEKFKHDWHGFLWAMTIFTSRAFPSRVIAQASGETAGKALLPSNEPILKLFDPDVLLYPMIDSINHNPRTENSWGYDEQGFWIVCNDKPSPGHEIFHSYGEKTNDQLFLSYGFVLVDNIHDGYALKLKDDVYGELKPVARRLFDQWVESTDVQYILPLRIQNQPGYPITFCQSIPIRLLNLLFLVNADNEELSDLETSFADYLDLLHRNELLDLGIRNRMETVDNLVEYFKLARARIQGSKVDMMDRPLNEHQKVAKLYRETQLAILNENIVDLEKWLAQAEKQWAVCCS